MPKEKKGTESPKTPIKDLKERVYDQSMQIQAWKTQIAEAEAQNNQLVQEIESRKAKEKSEE